MSRYRYRFTLHQIYVYYAKNCDLNWRRLAEASRTSTRTLRKYFEHTEKMEAILVDYHLRYLDHYYTNFQIGKSRDREQQFRMVRTVVARHFYCYQFTENAARTNLADRGKEIKDTHLNYIRNAMLHGGVNKNKIFPEMVFNFFLAPIPDGREGQDLLFHWVLQLHLEK